MYNKDIPTTLFTALNSFSEIPSLKIATEILKHVLQAGRKLNVTSLLPTYVHIRKTVYLGDVIYVHCMQVNLIDLRLSNKLCPLFPNSP